MTTPRTRSLVSLAAAITLTLAAGCGSTPARVAPEIAATPEPAPTMRFDNDARDYVHVYLVGIRREWLLGRVAPGARAELRVPEEALDEREGPMRIAVLSGERVTYRVAADANAASALPRPAAELLSREWRYAPHLSGAELIALPFGRSRLR